MSKQTFAKLIAGSKRNVLTFLIFSIFLFAFAALSLFFKQWYGVGISLALCARFIYVSTQAYSKQKAIEAMQEWYPIATDEVKQQITKYCLQIISDSIQPYKVDFSAIKDAALSAKETIKPARKKKATAKEIQQQPNNGEYKLASA